MHSMAVANIQEQTGASFVPQQSENDKTIFMLFE